MKVQLLYFDNCPNWRETDHLLEEAVAIIGRGDIEVEHVLVSTPEDAERWQFHGSPTVLVDGQDPFAHLGAPSASSAASTTLPPAWQAAPASTSS